LIDIRPSLPISSLKSRGSVRPPFRQRRKVAFKLPERLRITTTPPLTPVGKIDKRRLTDPAEPGGKTVPDATCPQK